MRHVFTCMWPIYNNDSEVYVAYVWHIEMVATGCQCVVAASLCDHPGALLAAGDQLYIREHRAVRPGSCSAVRCCFGKHHDMAHRYCKGSCTLH